MESVLVIRRHDLFPRAQPHGFVPMDEGRMEEELLAPIRRRGFFVERAAAEEEPRWKQVIPYCLLRSGEEILVMERLRGGGERRLWGKRSIGVGGHINPCDGADDRDRLQEGLRREVEEEVLLEPGWTAVPLGLINDDSTDVGAVHVGLVFGLRLPPPGRAEIREQDRIRGAFAPLEDLARMCQDGGFREDSWETWSRLVLVRAGDWADRF